MEREKLQSKLEQNPRFNIYPEFRLKNAIKEAIFSNDQEIRDVTDLKIIKIEDRMLINAVVVVQKGPQPVSVLVEAIFENTDDSITLKAYKTNASRVLKEKIESIIIPNLNELPNILLKNIEMEKGKGVEKITITPNGLEVSFTGEETSPSFSKEVNTGTTNTNINTESAENLSTLFENIGEHLRKAREHLMLNKTEAFLVAISIVDAEIAQIENIPKNETQEKNYRKLIEIRDNLKNRTEMVRLNQENIKLEKTKEAQFKKESPSYAPETQKKRGWWGRMFNSKPKDKKLARTPVAPRASFLSRVSGFWGF